MKYCSKCGKEIMNEAVICVHCGCPIEGAQNPNQVIREEDKVSVGLCILSVLFPIFGIIYWPVNHKRVPKRAQACGCYALASFIVALGFLIPFLIID